MDTSQEKQNSGQTFEKGISVSAPKDTDKMSGIARRIVENVFYLGSLGLYMCVVYVLFMVNGTLGILGLIGIVSRLATRAEYKAKQQLRKEHIL